MEAEKQKERIVIVLDVLRGVSLPTAAGSPGT